jgi:hypothetical protein
MRPKTVIRKFFEMAGYRLEKIPTPEPIYDVYDQDGLRSIHNHDFMSDPSFCKAYERGCRAASDYKNWHWRVHIGLWAGFTASKLVGDFVECGVGRGFFSSAIMEFLNWDSLNRTFYLLDTFEGVDPRFVSQEDYECRAKRGQSAVEDDLYVRDVESVKVNFSQWKNIQIIKGSVPETLNQVETQNVAYLHLDMNCSPPEVAAMNFFWDRLVPGAIILLDDYAYRGFESQKNALEAFGKEKQVMIASLPTGQGLLIKPPRRM